MEEITMKIIKFANEDCPSCDRAELFLNATGAHSEVEIETVMPYLEARGAKLAGKLKRPLMSFPAFVVYDDNDNELDKRMDGFEAGRTGELLELIDYVKTNS